MEMLHQQTGGTDLPALYLMQAIEAWALKGIGYLGEGVDKLWGCLECQDEYGSGNLEKTGTKGGAKVDVVAVA